nr:hypothetical protein [Tanacetum cinerariifolium]
MQDSELNLIKEKVLSDNDGTEGYVITGNQLYYKGRIVLPVTSKWIPLFFNEFHGGVMGGHSGILKTYQRMASELYWVGMKQNIARLPNKVWVGLLMDFIDGLPMSDGYTVILVVVDRLNKYGHFIPMRHPYMAVTVAATFLREVVRLPRILTSIVFSTAYHPQTDGQTEVVNRSIETYLRCFTSEKPKQWSKWLSWAECCNADVHRRDVKLENGKKVIGNKVEAYVLREGLSDEMEMLIQPEEVKGIREGKTKSDDKDVLIRWKKLPEYDATWEPMATIQRQFPDFHLEDALVIMFKKNKNRKIYYTIVMLGFNIL